MIDLLQIKIDPWTNFYLAIGVVVLLLFAVSLWDYLSRRKAHSKIRARGKA